jgi:hypothetical protein
MSLKKFITSATVAALSAGSLVPLSSAASARDFDHHDGGHGPRLENRYGHRDHDGGRINRWGEHRQYNAWSRNDGDEGEYRRHGNHNGRNVAIGAFALVLGLALGSEANRTQRHYYDDSND